MRNDLVLIARNAYPTWDEPCICRWEAMDGQPEQTVQVITLLGENFLYVIQCT